jgi:hypothetical protein
MVKSSKEAALAELAEYNARDGIDWVQITEKEWDERFEPATDENGDSSVVEDYGDTDERLVWSCVDDFTDRDDRLAFSGIKQGSWVYAYWICTRPVPKGEHYVVRFDDGEDGEDATRPTDCGLVAGPSVMATKTR